MSRTEVHTISATYDVNVIKEAIAVAESKGATQMVYETSGDKMWHFEWIRFYKELSIEEVLMEKKKKLQTEINEINNKLLNEM